jgi:hypothetical protein
MNLSIGIPKNTIARVRMNVSLILIGWYLMACKSFIESSNELKFTA